MYSLRLSGMRPTLHGRALFGWRLGDLKDGAFLAQLLPEEVELVSTPEQRSPVGKPVLHVKHACSGVGLGRPAANNMPLSEYDAQEV